MQAAETRQGEVVVLALNGRLDSNTSDAFEEQLLKLVRDGETKIVLDFDGLEYISSAGLRVLLKGARELKQTEGKLVVCSLKDYIKEVFDLSGFITFLPICENVTEAVSSM